MTNPIKNGQEMLDQFFADIVDIDGVNPATAQVLKGLYEEGRLTFTNIANGLRSLREGGNGSEANED